MLCSYGRKCDVMIAELGLRTDSQSGLWDGSRKCLGRQNPKERGV